MPFATEIGSTNQSKFRSIASLAPNDFGFAFAMKDRALGRVQCPIARPTKILVVQADEGWR